MPSHRITTAAVLIPVVLAAVIVLPSSVLAWLVGIVATGCGYEWARLVGYSGVEERRVYAAVIAVVIGSIGYFVPPWLPDNHGNVGLAVVALWWCVVIHWLVDYQADRDVEFSPRSVSGIGVLVIVSAWYALISTHALPHSGYLSVIFLLILVWAADIGAYFAGRAFGTAKLAPRISPGKTWAGVWGGAGAALLVTILIYPIASVTFIGALALLLPTLLFAIVGDLFESLLKRRVGVKDSGSLLPGHGGVLDRVDSLLGAAPVFAIVARILEYST